MADPRAKAAIAPVRSCPKTDLNQFCQRCCKRPVTKQDIVYVVNRFDNQYQAIVKLNCLAGQEYAGHLTGNAKDAEKSAAQQAMMAYASEALSLKESAKKKAPQTPEQIAAKKERAAAEDDGVNPAITPKTQLNSLCMKIAKRYLQKGETIYESLKVAGGYQATVKLAALPGDWSGRAWAGEVCSTKQKAEQSAAAIALGQVSNDGELSAEAAIPKGKGKGKGKSKGKGKGEWWGGWMWQGGSGPDLPRTRIAETKFKGEVVEWKETYGWVKATGSVDHPSAAQRDGKVYAHKQDVDGAATLSAGTKVEFYIYEDPSGLGAEEISLA